MSAASRGAAATFYQRAGSCYAERERWQEVQRDMDRIAAGKLPTQISIAHASAADMQAYRRTTEECA